VGLKHNSLPFGPRNGSSVATNVDLVFVVVWVVVVRFSMY